MADFINTLDTASTRPYLIRALYEWCTDNGFTPYVAVHVDNTVSVPREYVKNNEIVLNISFDATSSLKLGNDFIEFKARFAGSAREIMVPISHVLAIYARENGQGMAFPVGLPQDAKATVSNLGVQDGLQDNNVDPIEVLDMTDLASPLESIPHQVLPVGNTESRTIQLVPESDAPKGDGMDSPEPPNPPRTRPSLKRIK